jgi:thioredoxin reductase (NADPH)
MKDADAQPWQESEIWDCIVIGGGPAGLLAATYLARFRRKVLVADAGDGRALRIPQINNCPGFPDGISGRELVARLRRQATRYHVRFIDCPVERIERTDEGITARCETQTFSAKRLLLATGVVDLAPELPEIERNIERRALCLCPVCDGYEAIGKKIGVIGCTDHALREAVFLRTYSAQVSILVNEPEDLSSAIRSEATRVGVTLLDTVDDIYPTLGCDVRSELAVELGILCDQNGHIRVGPHQQTSIEGVHAAGDVVQSLSQIAVAFGQAATAATAIHNSLA